MKIVKNTVLAIIVTGLFSANVSAAGRINKSKIISVSFQPAGFFMSLENTSNPNACTSANAVVLLNTDSNYDKAYALLLAAYFAGKEISGYSNGCAQFDANTFNTIRGYKYLTVH